MSKPLIAKNTKNPKELTCHADSTAQNLAMEGITGMPSVLPQSKSMGQALWSNYSDSNPACSKGGKTSADKVYQQQEHVLCSALLFQVHYESCRCLLNYSAKANGT